MTVAAPTKTSPQTLLRVIVDQFDDRGWGYVGGLPALIVTEAEQAGTLDAAQAAQLADSKFLARNGTDRASLEQALEQAFANRVLIKAMNEPKIQQSITIQGDNNTVGDITQTGQEITLNLESPKDEVLDGVAALVRRGLDGQLSEADLAKLAGLIDARGDLAQAEIETVVGEVVADAEPGKLERFGQWVKGAAGKVSLGVATTLLVKGILAVVGIPAP